MQMCCRGYVLTGVFWAVVITDARTLRSGRAAAGVNGQLDTSTSREQASDTPPCPTRRVSVVAQPPLAEGLFGMVFERVLQMLPKASASPGVEMRFVPTSNCYGDALGNYFTDNLANASASCTGVLDEEVTFQDAFSKGWATSAEDLHSFSEAHALWEQHFSLVASLQAEVQAAAQEFPSPAEGGTLGVHFRGTDKYLEARPVDPEDMWLLVEDYVKHSDEIVAIFLATDDATFANLAVNRSKNLTGSSGHGVKLFLNHAVRSSSGHAVHKESCGNPALAKQALMDMLLLSQCDIVLKTSSQLSAWAKVFNPSLDIYRVNAFYEKWFPDADIPLYVPTGASHAVTTLLASLQRGEGHTDAANSPIEALLPTKL